MDTTSPGESFAERLRTARRAAGLSVRKAARRFDVSPEAWTSWEQGRTSPRVDRLGDLAAFLGCAVAELVPGVSSSS